MHEVRLGIQQPCFAHFPSAPCTQQADHTRSRSPQLHAARMGCSTHGCMDCAAWHGGQSGHGQSPQCVHRRGGASARAQGRSAQQAPRSTPRHDDVRLHAAVEGLHGLLRRCRRALHLMRLAAPLAHLHQAVTSR